LPRGAAARERGTVQAGPGVRGRSPCIKEIAPQAPRFRAERGAAPQGARSQPGGRSRQGAWGNWLQARLPAQRGAAGAACGQGGNVPGCISPPGVRERASPTRSGRGSSSAPGLHRSRARLLCLGLAEPTISRAIDASMNTLRTVFHGVLSSLEPGHRSRAIWNQLRGQSAHNRDSG
jgi:hypothetical protein